ncbi:hypothetical protein ONZ43_g2784 [Nemania bipapillata]|uniref:Uncharacterized protein n=1 Tax=Nemania bipapillata TaxID=110536 RepID=A0ACC2IZ93_9PEZI|nr:hypothetical protein ONZ43_g2784 [Nemania bipapillata]
MQINALGVTPSILETISPKILPECLRQVTCIGEAVSQRIIDGLADKVELRSSYGLSECAQLNFSGRLVQGGCRGYIGRPSDTTQAVVLIPGTNTRAATNDYGELCLLGPQLSDGYLNRQLETLETFVPNPFGPGRMLRTRDVARETDDGTFEISGRLDDQIKINGQRVEPGEISHVLRSSDLVIGCHIMASVVDSTQSLVAALEIRQGNDWSDVVQELKNNCVDHLPSYMIPSYWLQYESLPLNNNGKIDVNSIKRRIQDTPTELMLARKKTNKYSGVVGPIESLIRDIWSTVLQLDRSTIGREDNFLDLGGNSLQAIIMINDLRKEKLHITLEDVLVRSSIATLGSIATSPEILQPPEPLSMIQSDNVRSQLGNESGVLDAFPVTEFQASLLVETIQGSNDYTYQRLWDVADFDIVRLRLAFHVAFLTSPALQSTFISTPDGLVQLIRDTNELPWSTSDLPLEEYLALDLEHGFELGQLFFRVAIVQSSVLVVTMHHALFDYWSSPFLYEDVSRLYEGLYPKPRPLFQNFVKLMLQTDWSAAESFWREYLDSAPSTILNVQPTSIASDTVVTIPLQLDEVAKSMKVTLASIVHTAWGLVLSQYTGVQDVVFATTLAGRDAPIPDVDRMDGPTLTVTLKRCVFNPQQSLKQCLDKVFDEALMIGRHSQYGLRRILSSASQSVDFIDTMVNIVPYNRTADARFGVFKPYGSTPVWKSGFTLLELQQQDDKLAVRLHSTIEKKFAEIILGNFSKALHAIVDESSQPVLSIDLLSDSESELLSRPQDITTGVPNHLLQQFDQMVHDYPNRSAIQWQTLETITYEQLDVRSNQMASFLATQGVKPGQYVCTLLYKSPMLIIAMLGILKAGGCYVPLSPDNPIERNSFIINETTASLVISEKLVDQTSLMENVFMIEDIRLELYSQTPINIDIASDADAYIIYTSGSTGNPKGVVIQHRAAATGIWSMIQYEGRNNGTWRALQFSNCIFDASILDIFNTLNSGGTLCMAPNDRLVSQLADVINEMGVTHSFLTPTVARLLRPREVPSLKSLTIGGEALTDDILEIWSKDIRVIQAYGPTETAMVCVMREMSSDLNVRNLGALFPTAAGYILNPNGVNLVPYGAVGELCLAGPQLGKGYLNRPDLTSSAFIDLEIGGFSRLYRTGDLVRWLPGGEIEYLGRKDSQVKINGHRIELSEIEQKVMESGMVADCITVPVVIQGKPQLASFVVFEHSPIDGILPSESLVEKAADLRDRVIGLAHYMKPKVLIPLGKMPLMPSGKVARKLLVSWVNALSSEDLAKYDFDNFGETAMVVPVSSQEEKFLEDAFASVLGIPNNAIGRNANFLALGGDSIFAIKLSSYVRAQGQSQSLSVGDILKYPRLQDMALRLIATNENKNDDLTASSPRRTELENPVVLQAIESSNMALEDVEHAYRCPPGQAEFLNQGSKPSQYWVLMTTGQKAL